LSVHGAEDSPPGLLGCISCSVAASVFNVKVEVSWHSETLVSCLSTTRRHSQEDVKFLLLFANGSIQKWPTDGQPVTCKIVKKKREANLLTVNWRIN